MILQHLNSNVIPGQNYEKMKSAISAKYIHSMCILPDSRDSPLLQMREHLTAEVSLVVEPQAGFLIQ